MQLLCNSISASQDFVTLLSLFSRVYWPDSCESHGKVTEMLPLPQLKCLKKWWEISAQKEHLVLFLTINVKEQDHKCFSVSGKCSQFEQLSFCFLLGYEFRRDGGGGWTDLPASIYCLNTFPLNSNPLYAYSFHFTQAQFSPYFSRYLFPIK